MLPRSKVVAFLTACTLSVAFSPPASLGQPAPAAKPASAELPDTPAGRQIRAYLKALNDGDRQALEAFVAQVSGTQVPPVAALLQFGQRTGGLDVRKIENSSDSKLSLLVETRANHQFLRIGVELDPANEHRILSLAPPQPVARPPEFAIARLSDADLVKQVDERLSGMEKADTFAGAVLIMRAGKPVFSKAYGYADREKKLPNKMDTIFRFGSMGKMFTGVAVMQLVQAGKISLTDPVGKYLPDYPNKDIATKVTIEQLLTHRGGTGDIFGDEYQAHKSELNSHADYVKLFGQRGPKFEPGSRYEYSNYGFILLGRIIEAVSGQDYYSYVRDHVFKPAGMTSSGFWSENEPLPRRAEGYDPTPQGLQSTKGQLGERGSAAGGGLSTVGDFYRFSQALLGDKLLDKAHTDQLLTGQTPIGLDVKYAFGFEDAARGSKEHYVGHNGGAPGESGDLKIYPEADTVVVVLSNLTRAALGVSDYINPRVGL